MISRLLTLCVLLLLANPAWAQTKDQLRSEKDAARIMRDADTQSAKLEREAVKYEAKTGQVARNLSTRNFVRGGIMSGNLIQVPYVTNVNISGGYWGGTVSPSRITWPKGSGVEYGHTMSFLVGGEVVADNGDTLRIVSDSYNRSGGDTHPSGSHKYFYTPVPGYYNMQGDRGTRNQLNNNPDDRATLGEIGYYYVGGLSEDANGNGLLDPGEDLNGNGELDAELVNDREFTAQSNLPQTWPAFWPPQSYVGDQRPACDFSQGTSCDPSPGVRSGRWNGAFGAFVRADQEAFYLADDRDNDEFPYYPFTLPGTTEPDTRGWAEGGRRGIGVEVSVRQYQWASILAEDLFIGTFDVENISRKDIPSAIIAMMVDYDIAGQTGNNRALFDTADDITYQWLKRELTVNGFKVGYAGVGFLESPGIDDDGRDNDGDGMVDESRDNGIDDDGDWRVWSDVNLNGRYDNEDVNNNFILDPGEDTDGDGKLTIEPIGDDVGSDGLGPENEDYPGPDPDGTEANGVPDLGEPNFEFTDNDEIDQIGLTNMVIRTPSDFDRDLDDDELFWAEYIQPVPETDFITPDETADVIYVYASGFAEIRQGQAQRFSLAWFCGNDFQDMLRNKRTMQNIYDADYNFARPPRPPFLTAVPGDKKVTLIWDQSAETSRDPIYGFDFEMYKVYRSTDPEFNDIKTITDAFGNPLLWEPLLDANGDRVQFDLDNGLSGAHPVPIGDFGVSYDMGTDSGLQYSFVDSTVENGRTYYYAVVSVDQGYDASFFEQGISPFEALAEASPTESSKIIEVDAFDRPTNVGQNAAVVVPQPPALGFVEPQLTDEGVVRRAGNTSGRLKVDFLLPDEAHALGHTYEFQFFDDGRYEALDEDLLSGGLTTGFMLRNVSTGDTLTRVNYPTARRDLFADAALRANLYDGMKFSISNPFTPDVATAGWLDDSNGTPAAQVTVNADGDNNTAVPYDYELRVADAVGADTSNSLSPSGRLPTNFALWDVTNLNAAQQRAFQLTETGAVLPTDTIPGVLSPGDVINARVLSVPFGSYLYFAQSTWRFEVTASARSTNQVAEIRNAAQALYDSLSTNTVRGFDGRPYGPDLSITELIPFYEQIGAWPNAIFDSLAATPNLAGVTAAAGVPSTILGVFDEIHAREMPKAGDVFLLETTKPLDADDVLQFTVTGGTMAQNLGETALDNVYVVPDPYVAVNPLEARNVLLSGRGERRIDFRNLPQQCTIRIYTVSGRQVKTIEHSASAAESFASWNLQTDDGLDVAFGVYIYHVDAPGIGERIGRFSIIK
ncbi:MAG: hypothetical protein RhofKO_10840 [Rhodothermales bacterium]